MAELAYAGDLKSLAIRFAGSSPASGTNDGELTDEQLEYVVGGLSPARFSFYRATVLNNLNNPEFWKS